MKRTFSMSLVLLLLIGGCAHLNSNTAVGDGVFILIDTPWRVSLARVHGKGESSLEVDLNRARIETKRYSVLFPSASTEALRLIKYVDLIVPQVETHPNELSPFEAAECRFVWQTDNKPQRTRNFSRPELLADPILMALVQDIKDTAGVDASWAIVAMLTAENISRNQPDAAADLMADACKELSDWARRVIGRTTWREFLWLPSEGLFWRDYYADQPEKALEKLRSDWIRLIREIDLEFLVEGHVIHVTSVLDLKLDCRTPLPN